MISFSDNSLTQKGKTELIVEFQTWFNTPFGMTPLLGEALETVQRLEMNPDLCIKVITVAVSETMQEVIV